MSTTVADTNSPAPAASTRDLAGEWKTLLEQEPKLRIRDAAARLGVSEGELLATRVGSSVTRIEGDWKEMLQEFPKLGKVMALTRNESAVHERQGPYLEPQFFGNIGQVVSADIDLRIFLTSWHFGFAVDEAGPHGQSRSLQFFDRDGTAVHKIHLKEESNVEAFEAIREKFRASGQTSAIAIQPPGPKRPGGAPADKEAFLAEWAALQDTHDFHMMLGRNRVGRIDALEAAEGRFSRRVDATSSKTILESAAASGLEIMVFVGSAGCIQIHTGKVEKIAPMGPWINVLDVDFNLHLRQDHIAQSWSVVKPTRDGEVTSLEVYDAKGELIVQFFGKRKPGNPELPEWRSLVDGLPAPAAA